MAVTYHDLRRLTLMADNPPSLLFLAVPGTQETLQLDVESVRDAVARGEIGLDNWAWSAERNEWVPLAQLPEFAVSAAAEPVPVVPVSPRAVISSNHSEPEPSAARAALAPPTASYYSEADRPHEFPVLRIAFIALTALIIGLVIVNYFLVEQPFRTQMAKTPFANVSAHAHLGAFMQPTALLIHVWPSKAITPDNFSDLLNAMANSAPRAGVPGVAFNTVSLTPGWLSKYTISAADWGSFADMGGFTPAEKRQFVLTHIERSNGSPLVAEHRYESDDQRKAREDQVWAQLVATFQGS